MINNCNKPLKDVKLVYSQYKSFEELYSAMLIVTNSKEASVWSYKIIFLDFF